jgi:excisionase family DNA binding protein
MAEQQVKRDRAGDTMPPLNLDAGKTAGGPHLLRQALAPAVERQTYTVDEAARLLGISRTTAYECVRDGSLPALRFRKRVVVAKATIEALLQRVDNAGLDRKSPL